MLIWDIIGRLEECHFYVVGVSMFKLCMFQLVFMFLWTFLFDVINYPDINLIQTRQVLIFSTDVNLLNVRVWTLSLLKIVINMMYDCKFIKMFLQFFTLDSSLYRSPCKIDWVPLALCVSHQFFFSKGM